MWNASRHPFNGPFYKTTWVSRYQKGYTNLHFNEASDDEVAVASAGPYANYPHLTPNNHASTSSVNFYMFLLTPNQQRQGTEGIQSTECV